MSLTKSESRGLFNTRRTVYYLRVLLHGSAQYYRFDPDSGISHNIVYIVVVDLFPFPFVVSNPFDHDGVT